MSAGVELTRQGTIATITLRNQGKRNAMTRQMWHDLYYVFNSKLCNESAGKTDKTPSIRAIIVRGDAGHFCAGGDISQYPDFRFNADSLSQFHEHEVAPALDAMLACDIPLVAQIDGNCMGGGLEIAACCDIRIAGSGATFGAPIAKLGFPMAPREAAIVLAAVGPATLASMLLEAEIFNAEQMLQRGFLSRVVADDSVAQAAIASARRICELSPQAARLNKQVLRGLYGKNRLFAGESIDKLAIKNVANGISNTTYAYADSAEHKEGIFAFLQKRPPIF